MADLHERDAALLLDMLLAARDAKAFIEGLDEAAFLSSRLHQNAVIRSLEVLGEAAGRSLLPREPAIPTSHGGKSQACAIDSSTATGRCASILSGPCFETALMR